MKRVLKVLSLCVFATMVSFIGGCSKKSEPVKVESQSESPKSSIQTSKGQPTPIVQPTPLAPSVTTAQPKVTAPPPLKAESEPVALLRSYLMAPKWQDRIQFVRFGERVRPFMQEAYAKNYKPFKNENIKIFPEEIKEFPVGTWVSLNAEWDDLAYNTRQNTGGIVIFRTREGYKLDWEASLGYNPIKLPVFVAKRDGEPESFRTSCKLSNYYNYEYRKTTDTHFSIEIAADGGRIHGYVSKETVAGKRIFALLQDGQVHPLTLQIKHIGPLGESMKQSQNSGSIVSITNLVSESWVLPAGLDL